MLKKRTRCSDASGVLEMYFYPIFIPALIIVLGVMVLTFCSTHAPAQTLQSVPQSTGPTFYVVQADVYKNGKRDVLQTYISKENWKTLLECNAWMQSDEGVYATADLRARAYRVDPGLVLEFKCQALN